MKSAVIVDCVRTPIGRAHKDKGVFRDVRSDDLAAGVVRALVERTGIDPAEIEDVVLGNTQQTGEQGFNVARSVALMAGLPIETGGATINRLCGSSLQAINQAAHAIMAGFEDVQIVGGLEHMHHIPMDAGLDLNPKLFQRTSKGALHMGFTAEFLAQTQGISREEQDAFALRSHQRAAAATAEGRVQARDPAHLGPRRGGQPRAGRRPISAFVRDTSMEALAALKPAFMPEIGTVTAGNSSPLNDGAAALLIMSDEKAKSLGLKPLVRIVATAVVGVEPAVMGTGPVPATQKALKRAGLTLADIDLIEINEAFASQTLGLHADAGRRRREGQRPRRGDRHRPSAGRQRRRHHHDADQQHDRPQRHARPGHDVHRRRAGNRHDLRASVTYLESDLTYSTQS